MTDKELRDAAVVELKQTTVGEQDRRRGDERPGRPGHP